ncbi:hypothetical protein [Thauera sinica]|uniref:Lamin tail domain-containing protein n=1 Tax=Thauera sinica TaxID=2665146 RepID=A0ABW1ARB9_9RHOO|nr:hypothetical protein [Thauera sp. K11]ATE60163.1 hypothetical protein CCZ27_09570 [Thauera sp. K11]
MATATRTLSAALQPVIEYDNPGYSSTILNIDVQNKGAAAVAGWKVLARRTKSAPLRDITPASITAADGNLVVTPSPRAAANLAAAANTQLALNVTLWDRVEIHFQGVGAELVAHWESL